MEPSVREAQHQASLQRIHDEHRAWAERDAAAEAKRAEEQRVADQQHRDRLQRAQDAQQAQQRVRGEQLRALERQIAALTAGISTETGNALNALASDDITAAGDAQARALGLLALRDKSDAELASARRFG